MAQPAFLGIRFGVVAILCQIAFLLIFGFVVDYADDADAGVSGNSTGKMQQSNVQDINSNSIRLTFPFFQDVQGMMFLGFGFLMVFLKRYGYGSIGLNFMICVFVMQWAIIMNGVRHLSGGKIKLDIGALLNAEFTVASVLISFGAVLGKTSPFQLLLMALIEVPLIAGNEYVGREIFKAVDMGDTMFVHAFGAYFGLACARVICTASMVGNPKEGSIYHSDLFSMIGTLVLWIFWPSFNAGGAPGDGQHRAVINTVVSLTGSTLMTFVVASFLPEPCEGGSEEEKRKTVMSGKHVMVYVQNATLAGGVAVGTCADMMIRPWGALLIGCVAGSLSTLGYRFITPALNRASFHDTCGVNNLHGMPGILGGIAGAVAASLATFDIYGNNLYTVFQAMIPNQNTPFAYTVKFGGQTVIDANKGMGRSASVQGGYQMAALAVTLGIAIVSGILTGLILRFVPCLDSPHEKESFDDHKFWIVPDEEVGGANDVYRQPMGHEYSKASFETELSRQTSPEPSHL